MNEGSNRERHEGSHDQREPNVKIEEYSNPNRSPSMNTYGSKEDNFMNIHSSN